MFFCKEKSATGYWMQSLVIITGCCIAGTVSAAIPSAEDDLGVFNKAKDITPPIQSSASAASPAPSKTTALPQHPTQHSTTTTSPNTKVESTPQVTSSNIIKPKVESEPEHVVEALVKLTPTKGNQTEGVVRFTWIEPKQGEEHVKAGIHIIADVTGLTPNQKYGFHIHEYGDCSADDGSSAGGHFDPSGFLHGAPDSPTRHVGDLGNLEADSNGIAHYDRIDKVITFSGTNSIIGKALIIHEREDDFTTQPTGNTGARIACGVIESIKTTKIPQSTK